MEEKAQKAIETFFSKNNVVPSPWGTLAKHVTFSPNLASTAYYANGEVSFNVSQASCTSQNAMKKSVWTQTQVTVPPHVDLMEILGPAFTFLGENCQVEEIIEMAVDTDSFANSSLRRKLFPYENERTPTGAIQKPVLAMKLWSSPITPQASAPPESNGDICTPGSVKTQYSSSPITPRNCSGVGTHISPPSISPIGKLIFGTPSTDGKRSVHVINDSIMQTGIQDEGENDTFLCSVADMSCDESVNNHNGYSEVQATDKNVNKSKLLRSNFLKEPSSKSNCQELESQSQRKDNDQADSNLNSLAQDTGYQTASLQSVTHGSQGMHNEFGIADSIITPNSVWYESSIFQNEIEGKDFIHRAMQEKDNFMKHHNECKATNVQMVSFQEEYPAMAFNSLSWQPTKCSTPTKMPLTEIKRL